MSKDHVLKRLVVRKAATLQGDYKDACGAVDKTALIERVLVDLEESDPELLETLE